MTRSICVVTGSRADYGHLYWVLQALNGDPRCVLTVVVTGAHLSAAHGMTGKQVDQDGYANVLRADLRLEQRPDTGLGAAQVTARATESLAEIFAQTRPDLVLVLGDRYEILGAAQAALLVGVPLAHVHGGEITAGAFDDTIRYAVTKMAHLHFASAPAYARRIIQMGEAPDKVFAFGAPGLDHLEKLPTLSLADLGAELNVRITSPLLLVTYHPETLGGGDPGDGAAALCRALSPFAANATVLCTGVNADPGYESIQRAFAALAAAHDNVHLFPSLGQRRYLSALRHAAAVVGNSSSGVIEAPALGRPTVNIGRRQEGRLRAASVIDCGPEAEQIAAAIETALTPDFQKTAQSATPAVSAGDASARIAEELLTVPLDGLLEKRFHDLDDIERKSAQ